MMSSEKLVKPARTADDFFNRYSVADVQNAALKIRNPFSEALIRFAHEEGRRLTALIPNSEYKIGGSLGYNALLHDNYDLDLRLLLLGDATNSHIDAATLRLIEDGGYANPRFINEGGRNYIWHLRRSISKEDCVRFGCPSIDLTLNIQSASKYAGIADVSAQLPHDVVDRYVVSKELSLKEGRDCYVAVKEYWKCFVGWVSDHGYHRLGKSEMGVVLKENSALFPLFLMDK